MWVWQIHSRVLDRLGCGCGLQPIQTWRAGIGFVQAGDVCVMATQALKYPLWAGQMSPGSPTSSRGGDDKAPADDVQHSDVQSIDVMHSRNQWSGIWKCVYAFYRGNQSRVARLVDCVSSTEPYITQQNNNNNSLLHFHKFIFIMWFCRDELTFI